MNERIRELEERCWEELGEEECYYTVFNREKFAELIVRECLEACSRANEIRHFVPPGQQQVVLDCMREIEKHFGDEE